MPIKIFFVLFIILFQIANVYSQEDTIRQNSLENLSLKDLLNVRIVSASKKSELLFDAPLSASVLTREEIRNAGSTSIMEAMRLVPGMIVREESNGNYDIHLRGMDNVPPNASFDITSNTTTLVMIDSRPVYSFLKGGTFWETLPVDLNDVEKIEVVRGPAAALYGPNAVNGVINIITRHLEKEGFFTTVNSRKGSNNTFIENASVGYKFNKKLSLITSGNYQYRQRSQTSYYEFNRNSYLQNPAYFINFNNDTATNANTRYPDPGLAMKKYAGNLFLDYTLSSQIKFYITAGAQHSMVQKVSTENEITPLSTAASDSRYIDFRANIKSFSAQVSYNMGTQITDYDPGNKYDYHNFDVSAEYNYTKGNLSIKPGLNFRSAVYDDTRYSDFIHRTGIFNTRGIILSHSASLRTEYNMLHNKLRLVSGFSTNTFNYPDATYLAYQFAATYKANKKNLFRIVYSKAPRSSNIFDTYVDQAIVYYPSGPGNFTELALVGNKNLKLLTSNMFEVGYRAAVSRSISVDVEAFNIAAKNFSIPVYSHSVIEFEGTDTVHETPFIITNLPLQLRQCGITISVNYTTSKLQAKPFITLQQTRMKNYAPSIFAPDAEVPDAAKNNIYSAMGSEEALKSTPSLFGGAFINYGLSKKLNINVNAYYYSSQNYSHLSNLLFSDGVRGMDQLSPKLILNANISYKPVKGLALFCSGKNILNNKSREFFKTDAVPFMLIAGFNYEF